MSKDLIVELVLVFIPNLTAACSFVSLVTSGGAYQPLRCPISSVFLLFLGPFHLSSRTILQYSEAPQCDLDAGSLKVFAPYNCP